MDKRYDEIIKEKLDNFREKIYSEEIGFELNKLNCALDSVEKYFTDFNFLERLPSAEEWKDMAYVGNLIFEAVEAFKVSDENA